ncbi:MAG TPA: hypothetical protein VN890_06810 [Methylocella sp.]|nr:hypothetical protein [Methylocella sp.]
MKEGNRPEIHDSPPEQKSNNFRCRGSHPESLTRSDGSVAIYSLHREGATHPPHLGPDKRFSPKDNFRVLRRYDARRRRQSYQNVSRETFWYDWLGQKTCSAGLKAVSAGVNKD